MRCCAHSVNIMTKEVIAACENRPILRTVFDDFEAMITLKDTIILHDGWMFVHHLLRNDIFSDVNRGQEYTYGGGVVPIGKMKNFSM